MTDSLSDALWVTAYFWGLIAILSFAYVTTRGVLAPQTSDRFRGAAAVLASMWVLYAIWVALDEWVL